MTRLVVLGASNVRRGLPTVVRTAIEGWGPELEILGAFGHGRSYGERSRVLIRDLPGILECGIWRAISEGGEATAAVVTDVGNDVLYGRSETTILAWVGESLRRLASAGATVRVTSLPLQRIRRVSPREFLLFRSLFFPGSRVGWREAIGTSERLDAGLRSLAVSAGATLIEAPGEWYGADPIHIRRNRRVAAWAAILGVPEARRRISESQALRLRLSAPERRWIAGFETRRNQPALRIILER
ncbi:MAG TPA: hypothetical protein VG777_03415, partial [Thermoanaerobaculia bacterium]|nr:hypothetical protein [Thermoanaerobaculia bacterium]